MIKGSLDIIAFKSLEDWREWLDKNHASSNGIWIKFFKKVSKITSVSYAEAVDEALCYGWIDSQLKRYDDVSYVQKFTPRRNKSIWSKINTEKAEALIRAKRMKSSGLSVINDAKTDGRWHQAYNSPRNMELPVDFAKRLDSDKTAQDFYNTLNKTNKYAIAYRLQTAKTPVIREKRIKSILEKLSRSEKFY